MNQNLKYQKIWKGVSYTNKPKGIMPGDKLINPSKFSLLNSKEELCYHYKEVDDIKVQFECKIIRKTKSMEIMIYLINQNNITVMIIRDNSRDNDQLIHPGYYRFKTIIPKNLLAEGTYQIDLLVAENNAIHIRESDVVSFQVEDTYDINGSRGAFPVKWPEVAIKPLFNWEKENV